MLGPALGPGFVLRYDMVWVPHLALRPDFLGLGSALPRAVPSDAVVAVADLVLPGWLIQKAVLLGALVAAGVGAARLLPRERLVARTVAVSVVVWSPFVIERVLIGHWPMLLCYAAMPWLVAACRRWRSSGRLPAALPIVVVLGSLSASAGLFTAVALLALLAGRDAARRTTIAVGVALAANAPWLVAGLLHAGAAVTDPDGARAFALGGAGSVPAPIAALGLGGIWNVEVVPASLSGPAAWLLVALLATLSVAGARAWWRATERREAWGLILCWCVGWGWAMTTWAVPGVSAWVAAHVSGAGVLRDGSRALVLCAPLLVVVVGHGADALVRRIPVTATRAVAAGVLAIAPVALMPDAVWGIAGRLTPVDFPSAYAEARQAVVDEPDSGDVLLLPLSAYRQPSWNHDVKVLDPTGRYLPRDFVAGDDLVVSGRIVAGEDPRARAAAAALSAPTPQARAGALAADGIGWVAISATGAPEVAGVRVVDTTELTLMRLTGVVEAPTSAWRVALMVPAWAAFAAILAGPGLVAGWRRGRRRKGAREGSAL